jgi:hypothetical protein
LNGIVQSQGYGARRRISVAFDIDHYLRIVHPEPLLHGADNPQVGLVRYNQRQIIACEAVSLQQLGRNFGCAPYSELEDLSTFLMDIVHPFVYGLM